MKKCFTFMTAIAAAVVISVSCTANGKLQQVIENANTELAGKQVSPGVWCDGLSLEGDTMMINYSQPETEATPEDLANWDTIEKGYKQLVLTGLVNDKSQRPDDAKILVDAGVYVKSTVRFKNATLEVMITPTEVAQALK